MTDTVEIFLPTKQGLRLQTYGISPKITVMHIYKGKLSGFNIDDPSGAFLICVGCHREYRKKDQRTIKAYFLSTFTQHMCGCFPATSCCCWKGGCTAAAGLPWRAARGAKASAASWWATGPRLQHDIASFSMQLARATPQPTDRKSTRLNSSHLSVSRMPSSA